jgi:hypothetical protein
MRGVSWSDDKRRQGIERGREHDGINTGRGGVAFGRTLGRTFGRTLEGERERERERERSELSPGVPLLGGGVYGTVSRRGAGRRGQASAADVFLRSDLGLGLWVDRGFDWGLTGN